MQLRYYSIATLILLLLAACDDVMKQEVNFDVQVETADYIQHVDTAIIAPAGSKIRFLFEGEPDFITFAYERFLPTNATLKFASQAAWGQSVENSLQVLISESFKGLSYRLVNNADSVDVPVYNFDQDSILVTTHDWTDITANSNLPVSTNKKQEASIPINHYRGKTMVIAFRYTPTNPSDWQPSWIISDLMIENTRITDDSRVSTYLAATMGFTPFDLLNRPDAYRNEYVSGVWNTSNPAAMQIRQTARNNPLNEDWLISRPVEVPTGLIENATAKGIKNTTIEVNSYTHTFENIGEYQVTFKASNYNYLHQHSVTKTIKLIITD
jgi:hypothetical protein